MKLAERVEDKPKDFDLLRVQGHAQSAYALPVRESETESRHTESGEGNGWSPPLHGRSVAAAAVSSDGRHRSSPTQQLSEGRGSMAAALPPRPQLEQPENLERRRRRDKMPVWAAGRVRRPTRRTVHAAWARPFVS
jgi:hypothetical protein